jgi:hypothetical protein
LDHFEERFAKIVTEIFVQNGGSGSASGKIIPTIQLARNVPDPSASVRIPNTGPPNITFRRPELLKILSCVLELSGQSRKPVPGNQLHPFWVQGQAKAPNQ